MRIVFETEISDWNETLETLFWKSFWRNFPVEFTFSFKTSGFPWTKTMKIFSLAFCREDVRMMATKKRLFQVWRFYLTRLKPQKSVVAFMHATHNFCELFNSIVERFWFKLFQDNHSKPDYQNSIKPKTSPKISR